MERKKKTDLRVIRTQKAIREAFWQLMEQGGIDNVNVQKIVDLANINRSTFYSYYSDKYDLLDKMEGELLEGLSEIIGEVRVSETDTSTRDEIFHQHVVHILTYLESNAAHLMTLIGEGGDRSFHKRLDDQIERAWDQKGIGRHLTFPEHYLVVALSGMMTGLLTEWLRTGFAMSKEDLALLIERLSRPFVDMAVVEGGDGAAGGSAAPEPDAGEGGK